MPSVFTIEGTDIAPATPKPRKPAKPRKRRGLDDATPATTTTDDNCKWVKNPRTGCEIQLCRVDKTESRTGWKFKEGTSRCPVKQR